MNGPGCQYGMGCRRQARITIDGVPMCNQCHTEYQLRQTARQMVTSKGIRPLDLIPASTPEHQCGCGCGETITKARGFRPGHDARLKSKLIAARKGK